jgi:predicted dehydrogenase
MQYWPVAIVVEKPIVTRPAHLAVLQTIVKKRAYPLLMRTNKRFEKHVMGFMATAHAWRGNRFSARIEWRQRPEYMAKRRWYRRSALSGGGVVLGMGIHYLDILRELSAKIVVNDAVLRTYRCPPNAPDTSSENYAKVQLSSPSFNIEMNLSAWKPTPFLPEETVIAVKERESRSFRRERDRDTTAELTSEFKYYRTAIAARRFHPEKQAMIDVHELALRIYGKDLENN